MFSNFWLSAFSIFVFCAGVSHAEGQNYFSRLLGMAEEQVNYCSREHDAISYSRAKVSDYVFPTSGKFILVNIPSGQLVAYEDGRPVLEMKIKVGKPEHPTPITITTLSDVRINPTWTAPWSIVREEKWLQRIKTEPDFFMRNEFEFRDRHGKLMTYDEASRNPGKIAKFIQSPGDHNALGRYRFNIKSRNAIYLHDTRDPENFYDDSPLGLSHGCVRIEKPQKFAAWVLDMSEDEVLHIKDNGNTVDLDVDETIPVMMEYFTAWPDSNSDIIIYEDIYDKEPATCG